MFEAELRRASFQAALGNQASEAKFLGAGYTEFSVGFS